MQLISSFLGDLVVVTDDTADDQELNDNIRNSVLKRISVTTNDPGICVEYSNDADIHAALQLPSSLVPAGATPALSALALRTWFAMLIPLNITVIFNAGFGTQS